jgi:hypothetical protein
MKEQAIKLEITNSRNNDKHVEWFFCDTEEEKKQWIDKKKKEEDKWNYHTSGAVSMRYYNFNEYLISNLMETDISELEGMKLKDFIVVIKNCL